MKLRCESNLKNNLRNVCSAQEFYKIFHVRPKSKWHKFLYSSVVGSAEYSFSERFLNNDNDKSNNYSPYAIRVASRKWIDQNGIMFHWKLASKCLKMST